MEVLVVFILDKLKSLSYYVRLKDFSLFIDDNFDGMACKNIFTVTIVEGQFPFLVDW